MKKLLTIVTCLTVTVLLQSQTIIFVTPNGGGTGTSWADACNLETAVVLTPLSDQTEIWVQKGTHYPTKMLVVPASVKVYGGFSGTETDLSQRNFLANPTIIDGQNKIGSVFRLENSAEINGLTIQNGNANDNPHKNGGGVWADDNAVIENCKIINNTATLNGGGVYAKGEVKIINSVVENNIAGGNGKNTFGNCLVLGFEQSGVSSGVGIAGCNPSFLYLDEVSFRTPTTVPTTVGDVTLTWSDAVMAEGCNKTAYYGGIAGHYYSDCRGSNPRATYGDLFSWCAVARFAHVLCPAPWRVPTKEDFYHLDMAMGGNGDGFGPSPNGTPGNDGYGQCYYNNTIRNSYLNAWNSGPYGGNCNAAGTLFNQETTADFWAQSEHSAERGYSSHFGSSGYIRPQGYHDKFYGLTLRCVK